MKLADVVTFNSGIYVVRRPQADGVGLDIEVRRGAGRGETRSLPARTGRLVSIGDLPGDREIDVTIRPRPVWARLRHHAQHEVVRPAPRPFRLLFIGSGRCGTATIAAWLDGRRFRDGTLVDARHESLAHLMLPALRAGDDQVLARIITGQDHDVESGAFYALCADLLRADRIVHLVRDGRRVVQSGWNRGWYRDDSPWNSVKPDLPGSVFERCCGLWALTCSRADRVADEVVRLEDLATDAQARAKALERWGIVDDGTPFPHANRGRADSGCGGWSPGQRAAFARIGGPTMDRHYPGWRDS